jgi:hypothetical protein
MDWEYNNVREPVYLACTPPSNMVVQKPDSPQKMKEANISWNLFALSSDLAEISVLLTVLLQPRHCQLSSSSSYTRD